MDIVYSVDNVPIRLTAERWFPIVENHDDLAGHYDDVLHNRRPLFRYAWISRNANRYTRGWKGRYLAVVYRQLSIQDGFVITAYFTSSVDRDKAIWKQSE